MVSHSGKHMKRNNKRASRNRKSPLTHTLDTLAQPTQHLSRLKNKSPRPSPACSHTWWHRLWPDQLHGGDRMAWHSLKTESTQSSRGCVVPRTDRPLGAAASKPHAACYNRNTGAVGKATGRRICIDFCFSDNRGSNSDVGTEGASGWPSPEGSSTAGTSQIRSRLGVAPKVLWLTA